jgi:hypothetical protein
VIGDFDCGECGDGRFLRAGRITVLTYRGRIIKERQERLPEVCGACGRQGVLERREKECERVEPVASKYCRTTRW